MQEVFEVVHDLIVTKPKLYNRLISLLSLPVMYKHNIHMHVSVM